MSERLAEARRMRSALAARQLAVSAQAVADGVPSTGFERFERLRERLEHSEAVADAMTGLKDASLAEDLRFEELDERVEAELASLRRDLPARSP
jgi:phage shock protein A